MDYRRYFETAIGTLKAERRYRVFADLARDADAFPKAEWRRGGAAGDVTIWCSNDYLGMGRHPHVIAAMRDTAAKVGVGAGGTRNISGTNHAIVDLEAELADLHGKQGALVFTSGWISNLAAISTIADLLPNCLDPVRRAQSQFDDRGHQALLGRAADFPPQRSRPSRSAACKRRDASGRSSSSSRASTRWTATSRRSRRLPISPSATTR